MTALSETLIMLGWSIIGVVACIFFLGWMLIFFAGFVIAVNGEKLAVIVIMIGLVIGCLWSFLYVGKALLDYWGIS